jgi:hypothetical protein
VRTTERGKGCADVSVVARVGIGRGTGHDPHAAGSATGSRKLVA